MGFAEFPPGYRRMTDDDILFGNNSNVFVVDEKSAAASETARTFIMTCWYRKPLIKGDEIVDEWVERQVCWMRSRLMWTARQLSYSTMRGGGNPP
jgi:hypothetical protein